MTHNLIFVSQRKSLHSKLGTMSRTMAHAPSMCPTECPFFKSGCYAQQGPTAIHARRSLEYNTDLVAEVEDLPRKGVLRHFVSGDVFLDDVVNHDIIRDINKSAEARPDVTQFGYTHGWKRDDLTADMLNNGKNLAWNASCETDEEVAEALKQGWAAVRVRPQGVEKVVEMPMWTEIVCPNSRNKDIKCSDCMKCARGLDDKRRQRQGKPVVIVFEVHGAQKNKAAANVMSKIKAAV